jgi:metal-responsive CopG/Arc/MetJ family transcriptional regulator
MKTAISIPDNVYASAERLAGRLGKSRSQLYVEALRSYLLKHQKDGITKRLDEVYASANSSVDKKLANLQHRSLPKEEW